MGDRRASHPLPNSEVPPVYSPRFTGILGHNLKALLEPPGIRRFYTDGWGAYRRHLDPLRHVVGKQRTQQLEQKHLTLRTRIKRLVRKIICFSKSIQMHEIVIGLFINRFEFGVQV